MAALGGRVRLVMASHMRDRSLRKPTVFDSPLAREAAADGRDRSPRHSTASITQSDGVTRTARSEASIRGEGAGVNGYEESAPTMWRGAQGPYHGQERPL